MTTTAPAKSTLSARDEHVRELMDDPNCDPAKLQATLRRFGTINRLISGWGTVYRARLAPFLRTLDRPARVLDLGSGGGDVVMRLASLAAKDGFTVEWVGADPDARALRAASARDLPGNVSFVAADSTALLARGERFDAVISNHVLHHLDADSLTAFAEASVELSTGVVLHSDIVRSRTAYALYAVGITPFAPGTFLRTDGLRSIRRSYRVDELQRALGGEWRVDSPAAFRVLAERRSDA